MYEWYRIKYSVYLWIISNSFITHQHLWCHYKHIFPLFWSYVEMSNISTIYFYYKYLIHFSQCLNYVSKYSNYYFLIDFIINLSFLFPKITKLLSLIPKISVILALEHISFLLVFYFLRFKLYTIFDVCSYFFAKNLALGENFFSHQR